MAGPWEELEENMSIPTIQAKRLIRNPSAEELQAMTKEMPNTRISAFGNPNCQTLAVARSKASTFLVTDRPDEHDDQTIPREEGDRIAKMQDEYIRDQEMIIIDGHIGNVEGFRTPARLVMEKANANIAGMQKVLYFPAEKEEGFEPEVMVIYTPNLPVKGYPNDRIIAVDLENKVTRVLHSDYFGESKKGGLRMWNKIVYDRGGLSLHAGCKVIPVGDSLKVGLIVGLSGTGKTTTTFTRQNNSGPVQDDFVALMPGGKVYATENGCFAKTFGLDPKDEPTIHGAVTKPTAYLENVYQDEKGKVDFFNDSYTKNGRAIFPMSDVDGYYDAREIEKADFLLILNWNENIIPAVARLDQSQAAAYFMLGETKGTSAGGAEEAGKSLRVPGTNPFFPMRHVMQGNRLLELMKSSPLEVYLMNTGRVGGTAEESRSKKVTIPHSSAVVKAIADGTITWTRDPDFGYEIATSVPGISEADADLLRPRSLYETQGRVEEYDKLVTRLKTDRLTYMEKYPGLDKSILEALR